MVRHRRPILIVGLAVVIMLMSACGDPNLKKARRFQNEKNYDRAIHHYELALKNDPENQSARYGLIELQAQKLLDIPQEQVTPELVEGTLAELQPVAEPILGDPNVKRYLSLVYQLMAKRYAEKGRDDKVAEAWAKVAEMEPSYAEAQYNLGVALAKLGKHEDAVSHLEKAVSLNPYFINGYFAMGNTLLHLDRGEEAIEQYMKALELNPDDPATHHNLGIAYSSMKNYEKAVAELEKTLEVDPNYMLAYQSLIGVYTETGQTQKAEDARKRWADYSDALVQGRQKGEQQVSPTEKTE